MFMPLIPLLLLLITPILSQYQIPSYYGYWSKDFYIPQNITLGQFSVFQMHSSIDLNYDQSLIYYADKIQHCIYQYNPSDKSFIIIAGKCSRSGDRVGNAENSYFNGPSSIAYYRHDPQRYINATKSKAIITRDQNCQLSDTQCILNPQEISSLTSPLSLQNIRLTPYYNLYSINLTTNTEFLYITDRLNHCIKRITLQTKYTQVIAGSCGQSGFLDGPLGFNRLNKPSSIGVDALGVVFFFDEGNQYMRKINVDNKVETLLNGACKEYKRQNEGNRRVKGFQLKKMICYSNWIEKKTAGNKQHYFDEDLLNICTLHSSKCV